jgi:hypothetical protein
VYATAQDNADSGAGLDMFKISYCTDSTVPQMATPCVTSSGTDGGNLVHGNVQVVQAPIATQNKVTVGGNGFYPTGANYAGVYFSGGKLADGVIINSDGSANGAVEVMFTGITTLGADANIVVEGVASTGSVSAGTATINGTASVDMDNGAPPTPGVAFTIVLTATGMTLTLGASNLPTMTKSAGFIVIE